MYKKHYRVIFLLIFFIFGEEISMAKTYETRDEIAQEYKWNLSDIYGNWNLWKEDYTKAEGMVKELTEYKGKLENKDKFLEFLKKQEDLDKLSYKLYRYPQLLRDVNAYDKDATENLQKVQFLFSKVTTELSWVNSETISIGEEKVLGWTKEQEFSDFRFGLENLFRLEKHILPENENRLLSYYSQFLSAPRNIYTELSVSDVKWPVVELSNGEKVESTYGNYSKVLSQNKNQEDRKKIFDAHYGTFKEKENTYAAIYNSILQKDIARKNAYNYDSFLDSFLEGDNIPKEVYLNLIKTAKEESAPLRRYSKLRKKLLKLKEYHTYDGSVNLIDFDKEYDYETAKSLVVKSVSPLGEDYQDKLKEAVSHGWLDVFETKGKRSGAYSAGVYGVHPYMLLNYNETLDSVFTLGHELGHTLHTLYSSENQPFATHDYTIFVAEVASTFNERLLLDSMLQDATDPRERIALLEQAIKNITGTFYFQSLLADYEYQAHKMADEGKPITPEVLNGIMKQLFKDYYGNEMAEDELLYSVWARIPHFYNSPFYVYQYATCFASSAILYDKIINEKDPKKKEAARQKYMELLSSGGNDFPMEQLKKAGVDLEKKETIKAVSKQLNVLLDKLEIEIKNLEKSN